MRMRLFFNRNRDFPAGNPFSHVFLAIQMESGKMKAVKRLDNRRQWGAQIEQGPEQHVAADATEEIQEGDPGGAH